ncbi:hypothetical protein T4E_2038 [Trichinella pseudospiralis]|uniref:Uncharacterized protein n=1 Tax=Trichinella pseudospiralis TaxID=6337 RepID=A0A0V0XQA0_TRIPS|nr:hypothetical protein T4E_2038 [Trichinella pseudospiralis]
MLLKLNLQKVKQGNDEGELAIASEEAGGRQEAEQLLMSEERYREIGALQLEFEAALDDHDQIIAMERVVEVSAKLQRKLLYTSRCV